MADDATKPARTYSTGSTGHDNGGHEHDEDPLVELARIVSDDGSFFQSAPAKRANPMESDASPDPFSADLEAELMEQFEASLTRQAGDAVEAASTEMPAPDVYGDSENTGYEASDSQALGAMAAGVDVQSDEMTSVAYEQAGIHEAAVTDDQFAPPGATGQAEYVLPNDPLPDYTGNPDPQPAIEPIRDPYHTASDDAMAVTAAGEPHPNAFEMEFAEALSDTAASPLKEDFTPEFGVEAYGRDPEFHDGRARVDDNAADETGYPVSNYADIPAGGEADDALESGLEMPPPAPARSGGRKGLFAVAGVLTVVVLGGGVAAYISKIAPKDPPTPVPIIRAETGDVKVIADASDSSGTAPSVLDQIAGQQTKSEEKLIDRIEEPQPIARVVLPGPDKKNTTQLSKPVGEQIEKPSGPVTGDAIAKTIDRVMQEPQQPATAPRFDPIGPRKVRTVIVKPDGSVVSNPVASAPTQPALPAQPTVPPLETMEVATVSPTQSPEPTPVKTMDITSVPKPGETVAISGSGDAVEEPDPEPQPKQVATIEPVSPVTNGVDTGNAVQAVAVPTGLVPRPKPANIPDLTVARAPVTQAARSTTRSTSGPVNLLAAPAVSDQPRVTASTAPASTTRGYVVQVSSQRSADQARASFDSMKRRYKSILGGFDPDIQRADLGAKGTYYRVRVGPMASRDAALRLCEQLKSAGGSCFVTR